MILFDSFIYECPRCIQALKEDPEAKCVCDTKETETILGK
jgi:hypothetical protein